MQSNRPTFSESWYRVADLTPRLLTTVKVHGQHFRGKKWYVLQDPVSNQFFRLSETAYYFTAMLDGRRSVAQVWRHCMEKFEDAAPTQNEVIGVLGQLYHANLLYSNIAPDAEELFNRYQKRRRREVKSFLTNLLFIRIPLWDPDRFLDSWVSLLGRLYSRMGFLVWTLIICAGLWTLLGHVSELTYQASGVFNPKNLPLLYLSLVMLKILHEMGHALACKHFGRKEGTGGEVHKMGVTFLIFTPLPFVDASSAWALRNKAHRVVVGASGMMAELVVAAVAAFLWVFTAEGTTVHAISYNIMFIASVSTLLFNGNPFLRYDAYYILSDLLEIPNLESRSKLYAAYLVKRYGWGLKNAHDPSHTKGEKIWLAFYAVASIICRLIVLLIIIMTIGSKLPVVGMIISSMLLFAWIIMPLGKLLRYLSSHGELVRVRHRAVSTSLAVICCVLVAVGIINWPDRCRIEGVVEPVHFSEIYMETAGFIRHVRDTNTLVKPNGLPLIKAESPELEAKRDWLMAEIKQLNVRYQMAQTRDAAAAQILEEKIAAVADQIDRNNHRLASLQPLSPIPGTWVVPDRDRLPGTYLQRGDRIGLVADLDRLRVRAVAGQKEAARLIQEAEQVVEMRVKGRADISQIGRIETILPAGHEQLPTAALGYTAGGATQVDLSDASGKQASEPFFEILVVPISEENNRLRPGQRVILRFKTLPKPLLVQGWRELCQLFQPRFKV